jgi:hypothetical protein
LTVLADFARANIDLLAHGDDGTMVIVDRPIARLNDESAGPLTITAPQYIKGVLFGEMGLFITRSQFAAHKPNLKQALTALAIAARSNLFQAKPDAEGFLRVSDDPKADPARQAFVDTEGVLSAENEQFLEEVLTLAGRRVVFFAGVGPRFVPYRGKHEKAFTIDDDVLDGDASKFSYNPYVRRSENGSEAIFGGVSTRGDKAVGMSQAAIAEFSVNGRSAEEILHHYYGGRPPGVKQVRIRQAEGTSPFPGPEKYFSGWTEPGGEVGVTRSREGG